MHNIFTKTRICLLLVVTLALSLAAKGQSLPGDSLVFGPMFSAVYNDSVRVWVLTKTGTGTGDVLSLEVTAQGNSTPLTGVTFSSDDRLGYQLRSFVYKDLVAGQKYQAMVKRNGAATDRITTITNEANTIDDFEFLAGGCARIYDTTRCIDKPESQTHKNGDPAIFNRMAQEGSDLMVWLGDATYLLGLQHAAGQCPDGIDDWANKDMAFARYMFYRDFHNNLLMAMPQLAITDNHDVGPNEFNKDMPTLTEMKEIFMDWWPNPHFNGTTEGQGLFSSYKYKDVEYFLLDNRSYRTSTTQHLGPEQLEWLKQSLKKSTATFKVLISGTPAFDKHWGGRNFSISTQATELIQFIKDNNIDGVLCFSADIHEQELYGRYGDVKYPLFDMLSGNLNSDVGSGQYSINYTSEYILSGVKQTYLRVNVFGPANDRRMKIEYVGLDGNAYFETVIHADMLKSVDKDTRKLSLSFANAMKDSSSFNHIVNATGLSYGKDRSGKDLSAVTLSGTANVRVPFSSELDLSSRAFTVSCWVNPSQLSSTGSAVFSNATANAGITLGFDAQGYIQYTDHATKASYTSNYKLVLDKWTHMAWKYDNVKRQLTLYYNGLLIRTWSNVVPPVSSTGDVMLGNNVSNQRFIGSLDEVSLYGKLVADINIAEDAGYSSNRGDVLKVAGAQQMVIPGDKINAAFSDNFTIEFWGKLNADPGTNYKILASNGRINNNTTGISFEFPDSNKLNVVTGNNTGSWNSITEQGPVWNIGEWNHVAVSFTKNGSMIYYVNGEKVAEAAYAGYIGNTWGLGLGYGTQYVSAVQAEIDELRLWNVALPKDSIVKYMHYPVTGGEAGLQYYYDFSAHTPTSIISKGAAAPYEITLNGGELISGTSPVGNIDVTHRAAVTAAWSRSSKANAGLTLPDAITLYTSNVVIGKDASTKLAQVPGKTDLYYLKGGWQIDPLNNPLATIKINLAQSLVKADSISKVASKYYLLEQNEQGDFVTVSEGSYDGQNATFFNVVLEESVYFLGWKADESGAIGRGGSLSLPGSHSVYIPYADINPVLGGEFTMELWARLMKDPGNNDKLISNHGKVNNNSTGLAIEFPDNNSVHIAFGTNSGSWNTVSSNTPWNIGEWNHIAVTVAPGKEAKFYINGELKGTNAFAAYVPNTSWDFGLGNSKNYGGPTTAMIDEFRIWNKVKTAEEIREQMHLSIAEPDASLAFNFTFDQEDNGAIVNTGTVNKTVSYTNAQIIASTTPVSDMDAAYREDVAANWSFVNETANGMYLKDRIADFANNLIIGRVQDNKTAAVGTSTDTLYVKGGWLLNALNIETGTIVVNLEEIVDDVESLKGIVASYCLIKGDPSTDYEVVATGVQNGNTVEFTNIALDFGTYYLAYKTTSAPVTATYKINSANDDAEQDITSGKMYLDSSDIEFTQDGTSDQLIGLRFTGIDIPQGAVIQEAYIQFTVDEVNTTGDVDVLIAVEDVDNPLAMTSFDFDIYHRIINYGDTIIWRPGSFATVGNAGTDQRTPDLSDLLNRIVNRVNWEAGNAVMFTMTDPKNAKIPGYTGNAAKRVAQTFENNAANAARLVVKYIIPEKYYNGKFPIAKAASWKYNDTGADLSGTNWMANDYDDSNWAYGNAILGYGDGNQTTTLNYGTDAAKKRITTYLRHIFKVDDRTKYDSLLFDVMRDDGVVVYVNGTEAFRMNMPEGAIGYSTLATAAVDGANEKAYFREKTKNLLVDGINVIAVELHQSAANSSDLSFDMAVGYKQPPLTPAAFPMAKESDWNYLDKGTSLDAVNWKANDYADGSWSIGKAPLGYGDAMNTVISYGADAGNKYITYYFRRDVNINLAELGEFVEFGLRRDDGAIVYLNGTEIIRSNMPEGTVDYKTFSSTIVDGSAETTYYTYNVAKSMFVEGVNQIAVEIHNRDGQSSDIGFDLYLRNVPVTNPPAQCEGKHIGCFTSIVPTAQTRKMIIADEHRFQVIFRQDDAYTKGSGTVPGNHDFTAYLPINGSSELGRLSVNHENTPGGVSILGLHFNTDAKLWQVDESQAVDMYNNNVVTTTRNCSGGITPWGTVVTCEESLDGGDQNGDGYQDVGWAVEIDPVTAKVIDHDGDGKQDKLWALGRMNHENVVVAGDSKTVYYGEDGGTHCVYKFVANSAGDLSQGVVYVLKLDKPLSGDEPTSNTATWVAVPNATQADRNNMSSVAASLGGTNFNGVEDCEIGPLDGKIYFTSKGKNRVYRFKDNGATVSEFETFVGGTSYTLYTSSGTYTEPWGDGNDNLTFDDQGNLWVLQDGGNYYIWVVRPDHTQGNPKVELFASMPAGSEPTGLTFSPDYRFGFFSVQHPNGDNVEQVDATFGNVKFDRSATVVIALKEDLGAQPPVADFVADKVKIIKGNAVTFTDLSTNNPTSRTWTFEGGTPATSTEAAPVVTYSTPGVYDVTLTVTNTIGSSAPVTKTGYIEVLNDVVGVEEPFDKKVTVYPNPTQGQVTIALALTGSEDVTIEVFDLMGRKLAHRAEANAISGKTEMTFNLHDYVNSSQLLIFRIQADGETTRRVIQYLK